MSGFPWAEAMALGFGRLRLGPSTFWAMTPRELMAALGSHEPPMSREELAALMRRYPDERKSPPSSRRKPGSRAQLAND